MKRRVVLMAAVLVLLPAFVLVAAPKFRIAVSLPPANNAWQAKMLDSVNAEVAKDKVNFEITVKNAVDDADQLNQLTAFKAGGYDMILCLPGNGTLMTPICQEIYKAGIKLLIIDRPIEGDQYEFEAITAVIVGGTSLTGGRGRILGSIVGFIILGIVNNMMIMLNISPYLSGAVKGAVILFAVLMQRRER